MNQEILSTLDEAADQFFSSLINAGLTKEEILIIAITLFSNAILDIANSERDMRYIILVCNEVKENILKHYLEKK